MKKYRIILMLLIVHCCILLHQNLFAQVSPPGPVYVLGLTFTNGNDRICDLNTPIQYGAALFDTLLTEGDSVIFTFYFGDGDSAVFSAIADTSSLIELSPGNYSHLYSNDGTFGANVKAYNTNSGTIFYSNNTVPFYMGIDCGQVSGRVYNDCNSNCINNGNEIKLLNVKVILLDSNNNRIDSTYTDPGGNYSFSIQVGTVYALMMEAPQNLAFSYTCPISGTYSDTIVNANDQANFGLMYDAGYDLRANIGASGARPGMPLYVNLKTYNSSCNQTIGVFSELQINSPLLTFSNAVSIMPDSSNINSANWSGAAIPASGEQNIWVKLLVDSTAQIGDTLCLTYTVGPDTNNTINNQKQLCLAVQNSFDPNMKEVFPVGLGAAGYVSEETEFTYTVHFQNTGNAMAFRVIVKDSISPKLNLSTFQAVTASHSYYTILSDGLIQFVFNNINLPDSATAQAESNGSITFKIKAYPNLGEGTEITNNANIYFDLNSPIVTNTTLNTIELITAIHETTSIQNVQVFPNPTDGLIRIIGNSNIESCIIIDFTGRVIYTANQLKSKQIELDLSHLKTGFYIIQTLDNDKLISQTKLLKK